jgi:sulfate transport system ATP-binding protein
VAASRRIVGDQTKEDRVMSTAIEVCDIFRRFGTHKVLDGVNLAVEPGELFALLGPSGSGKTTLLRLIAGLDTPDGGVIRFDQYNAIGRKPTERGVGFVFQHYALFRHMTVFENIAFSLRIKKAKQPEVQARVDELLHLIQLESLAGRYPAQLSGGQRQRVALARALASQPRVLLLDEPFGALDAVVRRDLRRWLRRLHDEMRITTLFVTHDQEEAFDLADRVLIMNGGKICQQGTPIEIYQNPADAFVHEFLGESNIVQARISAGIVQAQAGFAIGRADAADGEVNAYLRPHFVVPVPNPAGAWRVSRIAATGTQARVTLAFGEAVLESLMTSEALIASGLRADAKVDAVITGGMIFDKAGRQPVKLRALLPQAERLAV